MIKPFSSHWGTLMIFLLPDTWRESKYAIECGPTLGLVFGDGTDSEKDIFIVITVIGSCYIHNDGPHEYKCDQTIRKHYLWTVLDRWNKWTCNHGLQSFHNTENTIDDLLSLLAEMENGLRITIDEWKVIN